MQKTNEILFHISVNRSELAEHLLQEMRFDHFNVQHKMLMESMILATGGDVFKIRSSFEAGESRIIYEENLVKYFFILVRNARDDEDVEMIDQ